MFARASWGRGYAYEAALAARWHGRLAMDVSGRLISLIRAGNERSIALARRLGARHEETIEFMGSEAQVWRHPEVEPAPVPDSYEHRDVFEPGAFAAHGLPAS